MKARISVALGVALGVVGLVALAVPELVTGLPVNEIVVTVLGVVLALSGLNELYRQPRVERAEAETPAVERTVDLPTPGDEFDRQLVSLSGLVYPASERRRIRERVSEVAVETLQRRGTYTEAGASHALEEGTWTDDPFAAAFFTDRPPDVDSLTRVREYLRSESPFRHRLDRAVGELYRVAEGETERGDDAGD